MLTHRHGGTIKAITHVAHETHKGVADWYFIGAVKWQDGTESPQAVIPPTALCYETDEDKPELDRLLARLNEYLETAGEWHEPKHKRDGRVYSWSPKAPAGRQPVAA